MYSTLNVLVHECTASIYDMIGGLPTPIKFKPVDM